LLTRTTGYLFQRVWPDTYHHSKESGKKNARNVSILRPTASSMLRNETTIKVGIKNKRLTAGWDDDYLYCSRAEMSGFLLRERSHFSPREV